MSLVKVAVLGACGWMGTVHTRAYLNIPLTFGHAEGRAQIAWLVDTDTRRAEEMAAAVPGARRSTDWRAAIEDPTVDLVDICLPDRFHYGIAKAALLAGKHVYCEKPLADTAAEAAELAALAAEKGLVTRVGHSYPRNPVHDLAKEIIDSGEIGEVRMFRGQQHVDTFGDPGAPFMWRADRDLAPTGIVGDTGSHVFSFLDRLIGRVSSLVADCRILTARRPRVAAPGRGGSAGGDELAEVTNTDAANVICRFENGAMGLIDFSRVATGRRFVQTYEIYGTRGSLAYDYDETNRLRFYSDADPAGRRGYRLIDAGPENPNYGAFLPLANLTLGYNEVKQIEAAEVVDSVVTGTYRWPTFADGHHIAQIVDACLTSSDERRWVDL